MVELRDVVIIDVPPGVVWAWLERLPDHYVEWHPDHIGARWMGDGVLVPGASMEVVERLHGKVHRLRTTLTGVEPGRSVRYRVFPGLGGRFDVEPSGAGSRFTAAIELGVRTPIVGRLLDWLTRRLIRGRIEALRRHQAEEGANLKALLERGAAVS